MKTTVKQLILLALLLPAAAFARLGMSKAELDKKYGEPIREDKQDVGTCYSYKLMVGDAPYVVSCFVYKDVCYFVRYLRTDNGQISDNTVMKMIVANVGKERKITPSEKRFNDTWFIADGAKIRWRASREMVGTSVGIVNIKQMGMIAKLLKEHALSGKDNEF